MEYKVRVECFEAYGLNNYRNFMQQDYLEIEDTHELVDTASFLLKEHGCPESAIFIHCFDGTMFVIHNMPADDETEVIVSEDADIDFFKIIDAEFRLCCYGLIIETRPNLFKIIER